MRTFSVGVLCFILGVMLALMLRTTPEPPPPPVCPSAQPSPSCTSPATVAVTAARKRPSTPRAKKEEPAPLTPLPELAEELDARRDRLRSWFAEHGQGLTGCRAESEPRRRLLVQMKIEPDGTIADAALLGSADLPPATGTCVTKQIRTLTVPSEYLRGRETLLIHISL
jgi:hypothetical protein